MVYSHINDDAIFSLKRLLSGRKVKQAVAHKGLRTDHKGREQSSEDLRSLETIRYMESQIILIEQEIMEIVKNDPSLLRNYNFIVSVKGVGRISDECGKI